MTKFRIMTCLLVTALICFSSVFVPAFAAKESVLVTKLANAVTIDGKWTTPDEWSDTNRVSMYLVQGPQSTGYVRLKHDANNLYLLVDFISDTTTALRQTTGDPAADSLYIGIDQNVNDTKTTIDNTIELQWNNGKDSPEPVSPPWVQGTMSYNATNDPDSQSSHAIYELAIPMPTFEKNSAVRISVWDPSRVVNMHWPSFAVRSWSTAYFGDLVFSEVIIPEFPFGASAIFTITIFVVLFIRRYLVRRVRRDSWNPMDLRDP